MCGPKYYEYTCGATQEGDDLSFVTCDEAPPICKKTVLQPWPMAGRCGNCATCRIVEIGGGVGNSEGSGGYDRTSSKKYKPKSGYQYDTKLSDERLEAADSIEKRRGDELKPPNKHKPTFRVSDTEPQQLQSASRSDSRKLVQQPSHILHDKEERENCRCTDCEGRCMLLSYVRCKNKDCEREDYEEGYSSTTDDTSEDEEGYSYRDELIDSDEEDLEAGFVAIEKYESGSQNSDDDHNSDDGSYAYDNPKDCIEYENGESNNKDTNDKQKKQPRPLKYKGKPIGRHYEVVFYAISYEDPEDIQKDILLSTDEMFHESNYSDWTREIKEMLRDNGADYSAQLDFLKKFKALLNSHNYKAHELLSTYDSIEPKKRQTWVAQIHKDIIKERKGKHNV